MNRPPAQCRRCGSTFVPIKAGHVYCDKVCRAADRNEAERATPKKRQQRSPLAARPCDECSTLYEPRSGYQRYCGADCRRRAANRMGRYERRQGVPICRFCREPLGAHKQTFCSKECFVAGRSDVVAGIRSRQLDLERLVVEQGAVIDDLRRRLGASRHIAIGPTVPAAALPLATATDALWTAGVRNVGPGEPNRRLAYRLQEIADGLDADGVAALLADLVAADDAERFVIDRARQVAV